MKIITRGQKRNERVYRYHFTCPDCETVYQLEPGDTYKIDHDRDGDAVLTWCPVCGKCVWTDCGRVFA